MHNSIIFTATSVLALVLLAAALIFQLLEMQSYGLFWTEIYERGSEHNLFGSFCFHEIIVLYFSFRLFALSPDRMRIFYDPSGTQRRESETIQFPSRMGIHLLRLFPELKHSVFSWLQDQHAVSIAEKTHSFAYCKRISLPDVLHSGKRTNKHQKRAFGQMKIRQQNIGR